MALIDCKNLTIGYDSKPILKNLNFKVDAGNYLCIVGENGSGKSTLMKTILHLINPLQGQISLGDGLLKNEIGYLPQQTVVQKDFPALVEEIVLSGCLNNMGFRPFYSAKEKKIARANMEKMNIFNLAKKCYRELSGGQQQRVLLARALCATKKLILLDEPISGLDPKATKEMYELINNLNKVDNITVIMITHDITESIKYANKILYVGKTPVFFESKEDYLNSEVYKKISIEKEGGDLQ